MSILSDSEDLATTEFIVDSSVSKQFATSSDLVPIRSLSRARPALLARRLTERLADRFRTYLDKRVTQSELWSMGIVPYVYLGPLRLRGLPRKQDSDIYIVRRFARSTLSAPYDLHALERVAVWGSVLQSVAYMHNFLDQTHNQILLSNVMEFNGSIKLADALPPAPKVDPYEIDYRQIGDLGVSLFEAGGESYLDLAHLRGATFARALRDLVRSIAFERPENRPSLSIAYEVLFSPDHVLWSRCSSALADSMAPPLRSGAVSVGEIHRRPDACWHLLVPIRRERSLAFDASKLHTRPYDESGVEQMEFAGERRAITDRASRGIDLDLEMSAVSLAARLRAQSGVDPRADRGGDRLERIRARFALRRERLLESDFRVVRPGADDYRVVSDSGSLGLLLAVGDHGDLLLPEFQFHLEPEAEQAFQLVNTRLVREYDPWTAWVWWLGSNSALGGVAPVDVLESDPQARERLDAAVTMIAD